MNWVDRLEELARLDRLQLRRDGGLAVVWGRRRVGKTRLLVEWSRRTGGHYFVADLTDSQLQRRRFAQSVSEILPGFAEVEYPDWGSLLDRLARDAATLDRRGPFVLDELPYLVAGSPELPSVLQRFFDHGARQARLWFAVAGSSQAMMQGLVLDRSAPLFGRAHEAFAVPPLQPGWIRAATGIRNPVAALQFWSTWGGLPRYWELAAPFATREDAVHDLVLDPGGVLHEEPNRLLAEEAPSAMALRSLLDVIGSGAHRPSELASRLGMPATSLPKAMARLLDLGLVQREVPFGEPERSGKRVLYRLGDPFLRWWFGLVAPKRPQLHRLSRRERLALFMARATHFDASAWEELCRLAVPHLAERLGHTFGPASRYWRGQGPEWDVVARGENDVLLLGEAKWSPTALDTGDLLSMQQGLARKGVPMGHTGPIVQVLFAPVLPRRRPRGLPPNVCLVDGSAVLQALR